MNAPKSRTTCRVRKRTGSSIRRTVVRRLAPWSLVATLCVIVTALAGVTAVGSHARVLRSHASAMIDARPLTIPALRQWRPAGGFLVLPGRPRIVFGVQALRQDALVLAGDLRALTGRWPLVARSARARPGDIALTLGGADRGLGEEGYELRIASTVTIAAPTAAGVFYGTRTLLQLLAQGAALPKGVARDWPRYPVRGLMLDLGRRLYPGPWIEREIRELAYLKLNVLHLHLTDDQRWGIQSDTHPEIVSPGALTKRQVRSILSLAARYQITVVPEIDMPGHMGALLARHPELELKVGGAARPPPSPDDRKLDISSPNARRVVAQLLDEYLPLFTGRAWDMGADEYLSPAEQPLYPQLQLFAIERYGARATIKDAILGFINWVDLIVRRHGKLLWAWHDELGGGSTVRARRDIVASWWVDLSPLSEPRPPTPDQLLAGGHRIVNDGWFPTYYTEDLGPIQGKPDMRKAYEGWAVNQFCSPTYDDRFFEPCYTVSPSEPRNLGSTINAWDDHELTLGQIAAGLLPRLSVLAQKTWESPQLTPSYAAFQRIISRVGRAPGAG